MLSENEFRTLLDQVRAGDGAAAAELMRRYEQEVLRAVRVRLTDPNLRRVVDSGDICQSVFCAFFVRVAAGQFELANPAQLVQLLTRMARNKVIDHARLAENRQTRTPDEETLSEAPGGGKSPSSMTSVTDLLAVVRERMSAEEWAVVEQRAAKRSWQEIAVALGTTSEAIRKRHDRAVDRVCLALGLDSANA